LKTSTIYPVNNGLDGRFRDSAARHFTLRWSPTLYLGMVAGKHDGEAPKD
jgi:hypothetical protein